MDSAELQSDTFTSETVGLLILNELRLMRRDLKAGLIRIESKVDRILNQRDITSVEGSGPAQSSNNNSASFYNDTPVYVDKNQLNSNLNAASIGDLNNPNFATKEHDMAYEGPVTCTVHVDVNELPDDVSLDSYEDDEKPAMKRLASRSLKKTLVIRNFENGGEKVFPVVETEDGRFQCTLCPQSFSNKGNLRRHYRYHTGDKRYQCHVCSKKFFRKDYLYSHIKTHNQYRKKEDSSKYEINKDLNVEKQHSCGFCNRSFNVRANLKRHMRAHTGEKRAQSDEKFPRTILWKTNEENVAQSDEKFPQAILSKTNEENEDVQEKTE